jgi:drug/metabolite transporter (DMT)-like permease
LAKDYIKLHFIVFIWGFTAILGALISVEAAGVVLYRTMAAALIMSIFMNLSGRWQRLSLEDSLKILSVGILVGLHWLLFFAAIKTAGASIALAGLSTVTLFTAIMEPLYNHKAINLVELVLGVVVIFGLYLIYKFQADNSIGLLMAVLSAMAGAAFSVINGRFTNRYSHHTITFYEMVGAALTAGVFIAGSALFDQKLNLIPTWMDIFWIFLLAGICTAYAYSVSVELLKRISVFTANLSVNLEPVYGMILAALILGEHKDLHPGFYLGSFVIISSLLFHPILTKPWRVHAKVEP